MSLSDTLLEWLEVVLESAWECVVNATLPALLLAVAVFAVQRTCSRWLRPAQLGLLWGIVLVRLMMPVAPQSTFSLQNLLMTGDSREVADIAPPADWSPAPAASPAAQPAYQAQPSAVEESFTDHVMSCLPLVWLVGFALILFGTPARYMFFAFRLRRSVSDSSPRVAGLLDECRRRLYMRRTVKIIVTDAIRQPAVLGIWRPKLLIPPHVLKLSDADLRMVLLHELAHVRCRDVAVNWLLLVVRAVHWANPVCWLAAARLLNLREQSRDAMVVRATDGDARQDYSTLLLTLAGHSGPPRRWRVLIPGLLPGLVCGFFEKQAVASRLKAIQRSRLVQPKWQMASALVLLAGAFVTGCTDPVRALQAEEFSGPDSLTQLAVQGGFVRFVDNSTSRFTGRQSAPLESRRYDITNSIKRIIEIHHVDANSAAEAVRSQAMVTIGNMISAPQPDEDAGGRQAPAATVRADGASWSLDAVADPTGHQRLAQQIAGWEQSGMAQIVIETRLVSSPIDLAERGDVAWTSFSAPISPLPAPAQSADGSDAVSGSAAIEHRLPVMTAVAPGSTMLRLVQIFQGQSRSNIMFAPKITIFNGQTGSITDSVQRPFVTGVRLVDGRREPQIEICPDGIELQLHPVLTADRTATQLTGRALLSKLVDVKTSSTRFADGPVTIQLPQVERRIIDFRAEIRDGESLIVAYPPAAGGKSYFYLLLTPHPLSDAEIGPLAGMQAAP